MLTLTDEQWQVLQLGEAQRFVAAVCDDFLATRHEMRERPGREEVLARMRAAYQYALRTGFTSTPHIVRLMVLCADAPRIHDDPVVDAWLRKAGATPEQRLDDLNAVVSHQLKGEA